MASKTHHLQLTQESLSRLMQVKRILKSNYNIRIHLQHEDLGDHIAQAISESHDEELYQMVHDLWEELGASSSNRDAKNELRQNMFQLENAWSVSNTLH